LEKAGEPVVSNPMLRMPVSLTEPQKQEIRRVQQQQQPEVKFAALRTWRIEGVAVDADDNPHEVGAQYSKLESECATLAQAGTDPDDMIKSAVLTLLDATLQKTGWHMVLWAWHSTELLDTSAT
jgi:hypothetical protein